jgi:D-amino-acid oxidase
LTNSAGVAGLTTSLQLAKKHKDAAITIVAKHMPGDYDIEYASPWAGANVLPHVPLFSRNPAPLG